MAEALVVVGAVASVVDLASKASKAVQRIYEFQSSLGEITETFDALWTELPAFESTLAVIQNLSKTRELDDGQSKILEPLLKGCTEQINLLRQIISSLNPGKDDSKYEKLKKGVKSLQKDKAVERATKLLRNYNQTLAFHCLLSSSSSARTDAQEKKQKEISSWLSAPDPYDNYHNALKTRHADTGQWFVQSEKFTQWNISNNSLWIHGIPGCGKTILSSTVIENILSKTESDPGKAVAFFHFDFNDPRKQTSKFMLHSLVSQISFRTARPSNALHLLFTACRRGERQPTDDELLVVLRDMLENIPQTYLVIDALDECEDRLRLMEIITQIGAWDAPGLHFLVTSRREHEIELSLRSFISEQNTVCLRSSVVDTDIRSYVQQRLNNDPGLRKWQKDVAIKEEIEKALMSGAQGMFRWATCQLDCLSKCRNRSSLHKALKSLPPTLDETYDRILCAIDENDADYAYRILYWLAFSKRPLRIEEAAETIAISSDRDPAFVRDEVLEDPHEALALCMGLISINSDENRSAGPSPEPCSDTAYIVLAHYSVKEYLISDRIHRGGAKRFGMSSQICHNLIAECCIHYLLQIEEPHVDQKDWLDRNALAQYSAISWCYHAQANGDAMADALHRLIYSLFTSRTAFSNWLKIEKPDRAPGGKSDEAKLSASLSEQMYDLPTPIYYACMLGLSRVAEQLARNEGADVNVKGGRFGSPLQAAAIGCQEATVKFLVDNGADVNLQGGRHGNALTAACVGGRVSIVKLLLDNGADVNATGGRYHTALQAASIEGHVAVVRLLLERDADVDANGGRYGTALQAASIGSWEAITKLLLLDGGADINAVGGRYGSALQAACVEGHENIVRLLLEHGADATLKGGRYGSALQAATVGGHDNLVKLLVQKGVDVNASEGEGYFGSALQTASRKGNEGVVRLLLDAGADVTIHGGHRGTPVQEAMAGKHTAIVTILQAASP